MIVSCAFPGCDFQTEDVSESIACVILQSHAFSHASAAAKPAVDDLPMRNVKGPTLDRPHVDVGVSLEEWNIFVRRWDVFRQGSGFDVASASPQLFQCASQALGDTMLKSDAQIASKPLPDLLQAMKCLAVIPISTGVLRSELMQMRQMREEPFRSFAARVRGKADTCAFSTECT